MEVYCVMRMLTVMTLMAATIAFVELVTLAMDSIALVCVNIRLYVLVCLIYYSYRY